MASARRHLNATLLADGRVVATGGTRTGGFSDLAGATHAAEVWDPATGEWSTWASAAVSRVYHSTTMLLPDGRLLHTGGGDGANLPRELSAELFTPPYLLRGPRPAIASAPSSVAYGEGFQVSSPDAGAVTRVTLVRLPSVTHAFDQNQRFVPVAFARSAGGPYGEPSRTASEDHGHEALILVERMCHRGQPHQRHSRHRPRVGRAHLKPLSIGHARRGTLIAGRGPRSKYGGVKSSALNSRGRSAPSPPPAGAAGRPATAWSSSGRRGSPPHWPRCSTRR